MSLLYHDGFDGSRWNAGGGGGGAAAYLERQGWLNYGNVGASLTARPVTGRGGNGYALDTATFFSQDPSFPLGGTYTDIFFGFAIVYNSGLHAAILLASGLEQVTVLMTAARELQIIAGGSGGTLVATSGVNALPASGFAYVEIKLTTTQVEVRVDTSVVIPLTTFPFPHGSGVDEFKMGRSTGVDDLYIVVNDSVGFSDYLGDVISAGLIPDSDDSVQWTPNTGTDNYAMLATPDAIDDDTTYVRATSAVLTDLYGVSSSFAGSGYGVAAVTVRTMCYKESGATCQFERVTKIGGTTYAGSPTTPARTNTYGTERELIDSSPATSADWDLTEVLAASWGVRTVSGIATPIRVTSFVVDVLLYGSIAPPTTVVMSVATGTGQTQAGPTGNFPLVLVTGVGSSAGKITPSFPLTFQTWADLDSSGGGSLPESSLNANGVTVETETTASQAVVSSPPTIVVFENRTSADVDIDPRTEIALETVVGARTTFFQVEDGRLEIVSSGRYRR